MKHQLLRTKVESIAVLPGWKFSRPGIRTFEAFTSRQIGGVEREHELIIESAREHRPSHADEVRDQKQPGEGSVVPSQEVGC